MITKILIKKTGSNLEKNTSAYDGMITLIFLVAVIVILYIFFDKVI